LQCSCSRHAHVAPAAFRPTRDGIYDTVILTPESFRVTPRRLRHFHFPPTPLRHRYKSGYATVSTRGWSTRIGC
jgi:hypothetical protein